MKGRLISYSSNCFQGLNDEGYTTYKLTIETLYLKRKKVIQREISDDTNLELLVGKLVKD